VISLASGTPAASTTSVASMTSTASFHQKLNEFDVSVNPDTKMTYPGLLMWDGSSKIHYFMDFGTLSLGSCGGRATSKK
jgi:hypothetical protein